MADKTIPLIERSSFVVGMTALGGFTNAYTFMTRGGVFSNAHTANMAKLGISLATLDGAGALTALVPIVGCFLGIMLCEFIKDKSADHPKFGGGHWHSRALLFELLVFAFVGFLPQTVPHMVANSLMSFVTGFQLDIFRTWHGGAHNTTICTGNLRTAAQRVYAALAKKDPHATRDAIAYGGVLFSFSAGAVASTLLCGVIGVRAIWIACAFLIVWLVRMHFDK